MLAVALALTGLARAQTFTTLYGFMGSADGGVPAAALIQDQADNLYGTTVYYGDTNCNPPNGCGVVFELDTSGAETVLHSFSGGTTDGEFPSGLLRDSSGNLYGTAEWGGTHDCGVVFRLDTAGNETILYNFTGGSNDGCNPVQGLVADKSDNLYSTVENGGASSCGAVFQLTPKGKVSLMASFPTGMTNPYHGHLLIDKDDNLYGVTEYGGPSTNGVLYKVTPKRQLVILHNFTGGTSDGCYPFGTVAMDEAGNLYGTTSSCGTGLGTVWKFSKEGKETILHNFDDPQQEGGYPEAGVITDSADNLYSGTTAYGSYDYGTMWELTKTGTFTVLHTFTGGSDGAVPVGEFLETTGGELVGTASEGGNYGAGTVWSYAP